MTTILTQGVIDEILIKVNNLNIKYNKYSIITVSDNSIVIKLHRNGNDLFVKYYKSEESRREKIWYLILKNYKIKTIYLEYIGEDFIISEDISSTGDCRLGIENDLYNEQIAYNVGKWIKSFHSIGTEYLKNEELNVFNELNFITKANIDLLITKIGEDCKTSRILKKHYKDILDIYSKMSETFVYRDIWYVNFVVKQDESEVYLYDFDKSGIGLAYLDILYAEMCFSAKAFNSFIEGYGDVNKHEAILSEIILDLYRLILYYQSGDNEVPGWAMGHLERYKNGKVGNLINLLISKNSD